MDRNTCTPQNVAFYVYNCMWEVKLDEESLGNIVFLSKDKLFAR